MYRESRKHPLKLMYQRRLNSLIFKLRYGCRKLTGSLNPSLRPTPIAMSAQPEKSS
jgi:hypothetical protein